MIEQSPILKILAFSVPIAVPLIVFCISARLGFWWQIALTTILYFVTLPISFVLMLLASDAALFSYDHINPGIGVAAIPVVIEWTIIFLIGICVITILVVKRVLANMRR